MHNEIYLGRDRPGTGKESLPIGGAFVDWDLSTIRLKRTDKDNPLRISSTPGNKLPDSKRLFATDGKFDDIMSEFGNISTGTANPVRIDVDSIVDDKKSFAMTSFRMKTESGLDGGAERGTTWLPRFNPRVFLQDFYSFDAKERDKLPFELYVRRIDNFRNLLYLQENDGRAFFGAGWSPGDGGQPSVVALSVPREPLISLGAFQHSSANGFLFQQPKETPGDGYGPLNSRDPLNPQISHAIGNSEACAVIAPEKTFSIMSDGSGRPLADHSYLANRALWDDWFLSSIAPMPAGNVFSGKTQKDLAKAFFEKTGDLPNHRYRPDAGSLTATEAINTLFSGSDPRAEAKDLTASLLRVEGMFNVNSTSVDAWKSVLSGLRNETVATIDGDGAAKTKAATSGTTPITGLLSPFEEVADDADDRAAWTGRRELSDEQIDELAVAIVREIRASGPFLSLADFVNRRPGTDKRLAAGGVIARALDKDLGVTEPESGAGTNDAFRSGDAVVTNTVANRFEFPEAEEGLKSDGIPGIVKQADILTPIAPFISVRSDSFLVRTYGEAVDSSGNVTAKAWCEREWSATDPS